MPGGRAGENKAREEKEGAAVSEAWDAYMTTEVRIELPDGAVRVFAAPPFTASGGYPDPAGRPIAVITAHNPHGRIVSADENEKAQGDLETELTRQGRDWWPAAGADPTWTHVEQSVAVPGMDEAEALELGTRYGQEAIFILTPASRKVVDCVSGRRSITGWVIASEADLAEDDFETALENELEHLVSAHGPDPCGWAVPVLAESRWETGGEFLLRIGEAYVIYETDTVEWDWDYMSAPGDEPAIAAFREAVGDE
jgi:hypothetical protein